MADKILEQEKVLKNDKKSMLVSASAGSGKTFVMIQYITQLVCKKKIPISELVVLTFTKAAAGEMKERLLTSLKEQGNDPFIVEQIDALPTANISTIHSFCEKNLKKYANLVGINEDFSILDEVSANQIRELAFDRAYRYMHDNLEEEYMQLAEFYKNNKQKVRGILFQIEELVEAVADRNKFITDNLNKAEQFFDDSLKYLYTQCCSELRNCLIELSGLGLEDKFSKTCRDFENALKCKDLFELSKCSINFEKRPPQKQIGIEAFETLDKIKKSEERCMKKIQRLNLADEENVEFQRSGKLEKLILKLFDIYQKEEGNLKRARNVLSFSDLEKYMAILSERQNLFDGIKYVFVDEYQDTNKIQEKIVKNVAKNCNFVAVGDVKQGIYGFRLASCEIFLKDLKEFDEEENASVNFLKSNFRSDQKILDFVNEIFSVCMTEESSGVNYKQNSMLKSRKAMPSNGSVVTIDLIVQDQEEKGQLPDVYSVKDATSVVENKDIKLLMDVKRRIYEAMKTQIYEKNGWRDCKFGDIAILSRKRSDFFNSLAMYLQQSGLPVVANTKKDLLQEVEIQVLLNILKISLNYDDDIALLSVLISPFGGFSLEQILEAKDNNQSLSQFVVTHEMFSEFRNKIEQFRKNYLLFGIKKAFLLFFNDVNYLAYINLKKNGARAFVDRFLIELENCGFNFDIAGAIDYFENADIKVSASQNGEQDNIVLTTIHDSKGLEYPIVFLIGCDQNLKDGRENYDVKINEKFGFALKYYDTEKNQEVVGAKMLAISDEKERKDFVEELMIFYVALTRAKNRLYLFGNYKEDYFKREDLKKCECYFDLIFYALKNISTAFPKKFKYENKILNVNYIEDIEQKEFLEKQNFENSEFDERDLNEIVKYLNFKYDFEDKLNFKLKESVTSLNNKSPDNKLEKFSNDSFVFTDGGVEIGNAYHLALKLIDFEQMHSVDDVKNALQQIEFEGKDKIDAQILWKNIEIAKSLVSGGQIIKEKPFILKEKLCNLLEGVSVKDEIMVQGVIDIFAVKPEEIVLIDYKYTNSNNSNYLIEKYKNQLKFYKIALENYFKKPVKQVYLLSIKQAKLINVEL